MKQLMLGVHNYMDANKETFPDGLSNAGSNNSNRWGFIAMLLPFIEETALYNDLGVNPALPMPTVATKPVLETTLPAFLCPSCTGPKINPNYNNLGKSNYACSDGVMRLAASSTTPTPIRIRNVTDGMSKTIAIGERALNTSAPIFGGANWAGQGGGFSTSSVLLRCVWRPNSAVSVQPFNGTTDSADKRYALSSRHPGGANVAMCDGAVKFIQNEVDSYATPAAGHHAHMPGGMNTDHLYQRLYVKDDGKPVGEF
jgi:prepilin-type processing-associated H-X9-DG protein